MRLLPPLQAETPNGIQHASVWRSRRLPRPGILHNRQGFANKNKPAKSNDQQQYQQKQQAITKPRYFGFAGQKRGLGFMVL